MIVWGHLTTRWLIYVDEPGIHGVLSRHGHSPSLHNLDLRLIELMIVVAVIGMYGHRGTTVRQLSAPRQAVQVHGESTRHRNHTKQPLRRP